MDFPTIQVNAGLPGADPETMATSVAAPLERQFGRIAGVTEMTSTSFRGTSNVTLQFDLNRNIDGAARDVQAAINAARGFLPPNLPNNPTYRKVNPADAPILIVALTSDIIDRAQLYDAASSIMQQKLSQVKGVGQVFVGGGSLPAVRVELNPSALFKYGIGMEGVRGVLVSTSVNRPKGQVEDATRTWEITANDQLRRAAEYQPVIVSYKSGAAVRLSDVGHRGRLGGGCAHHRTRKREACDHGGHLPAAGGEYHRDGGPGSATSFPNWRPLCRGASPCRWSRTGLPLSGVR